MSEITKHQGTNPLVFHLPRFPKNWNPMLAYLLMITAGAYAAMKFADDKAGTNICYLAYAALGAGLLSQLIDRIFSKRDPPAAG